MIETVKQSVAGQYQAAFLTLQKCIDLCPPELWDAPVANNPYCQSLFHALFYGDLYLGSGVEDQRQQSFHTDNPGVFRDYEELESRKPVLLYERQDVQAYLNFCQQKAKDKVAAEDERSLARPVEFSWLKIGRLEMHLYNIRHLQHHAAQLILRLRLHSDPEISWVRTG